MWLVCQDADRRSTRIAHRVSRGWKFGLPRHEQLPVPREATFDGGGGYLWGGATCATRAGAFFEQIPRKKPTPKPLPRKSRFAR